MLPAGPPGYGERMPPVPGPAGLLHELFPHLRGLRVEAVEGSGQAVVIWACPGSAGASCPRCGTWSARVHSRYARRVADGAVDGRPVVICLTVRRLFCGNPGCAAVTFAEQAEGLTGRYRRRSLPLLDLLTQVALALAGRAGSRLAAVLGIAVHPVTLLRLVTALPGPEVSAAPQVLGIDDFALRKGQVYGTVLVDVDSGDVIDLLPDREAATVETWLKAHPGATVICRDRAGAYAEGARNGAPAAIQVADRWHLWHNLAEYAEKAVVAHRGCLKDPPPPDPAVEPGDSTVPAAPPLPPAEPDGLRDVCGRERRLVTRTRERHAAVHQLLAAGHSLGSVSRTLGLDRGTVQRFAREPDVDKLLVKATNRETRLAPFKAWIHQRWNEGITDASVLHAELQARGWTGSVQAVRRYVRPFRAMTAAPPPPPAVPKTRQITTWLLRRPESLSDDEQARLAAIRARCPHIDALAGHVTSFAEMMTHRTGENDLENWLATVEAGDLPELRSFAAGIRTDQQAVTNGLTLPYSSGKVEGTVNKIKMLKRQMYGRASFALLRKRVILHPS
jgi:transposase